MRSLTIRTPCSPWRNEVEQVVRVLLSTTKLLATTALGERIHANGTYKLIWQGFPVIVVGTTDARRSFVLGGLAICSGETVEDYQFAFDTIPDWRLNQKKNLILSCPSRNFRYSVTDCAPAIPAAASLVFGKDIIRLVCWYHVKKAIDKRIQEEFPEAARASVSLDVVALQLAPSEAAFKEGLPAPTSQVRQPQALLRVHT